MTKNELIKQLQAIPGNPEVVLWNGFVEDYMRISSPLTTLELVKHTKEFLEERGPKMSDKEYKARRAGEEWDFPNPYVPSSDYPRWYGYNRKKIILLQGELRGKTSYDRLGKLQY